MASFAQALFYPRELLTTQLKLLVAGVLEDPSLDVVQFGDGGGTADRELAIPFLAGMDEVVVDDASLRLSARSLELDLPQSAYSVSNASGDNVGVVVSLKAPGRLTRIVMDNPTFTAGVKAGQRYAYGVGGVSTGAVGAAETMRLVVRTATPKSTGGFDFGPPIFVDQPFRLDSPFFGLVLGGLSVSAVSGSKLQLTFPPTSGSAWLVQFAFGDEAAKLKPLAYTSAVSSVRVAASPTNLSIVVPGEDGGADTVLWSYANALLPEVGDQDVSFTPVAQTRLAAELEGASVTLPVPLRFASETAGKVAIEARTLDAHYRVFPLGPDPVEERLGGGWTPLRLAAPAALRPAGGELQLTAVHLGRALNDGSPVPPLDLPASGVRVDSERWAATATPFLAPAGTEVATLPLVSVQVPLEAQVETEVSLEIRGGAANTPAAPLGPPVVRQLDPGTRGWIEFELPQPLELPTGGEPPWVSLRTTKGEVRWFAEGAGTGRISADGGETWGEVDPLLVDAATPLALLFHAVSPPYAPPQLELRLGPQALPPLVVGVRSPADEAEFSLPSTAVPAALVDAVAHTVGTGRATTVVSVFSRAVCDLTIASLSLRYEPAGG